MSSRGEILSAVRANQPELTTLPDVEPLKAYSNKENLLSQYTTVATNIGAKVYEVKNISEVKAIIQNSFGTGKRIVSTLPELNDIADTKEFRLPRRGGNSPASAQWPWLEHFPEPALCFHGVEF